MDLYTIKIFGLSFLVCFVIAILFAIWFDIILKDNLRDVCCSFMLLFGLASAFCAGLYQEEINTTICTYCEEKVDVDYAFCPYCGTNVILEDNYEVHN